MKLFIHSIVSLLLFMFFSNQSIAQPVNAQKKSQAIPVERLKSAKIVEDLIALFPAHLEIVWCRISIAGKDAKYSEHVLPDHTLPELIKNVRPGQWMFVGYILVKKKGSRENKVGAYDPIELVVTDSK